MDHLKLTLLVSSFIIPLILAITLFVSSKNNLSKKIMGFGLLNAFFVFLANYIYFYKLFETYSYVHSLHIATVLWIFPSIYLYIKSIVESEKQLKKEFWHFLPGFVFGITSAILFGLLLSHDEKIYYLSNYRSGVQFESQNIKMVSVFRSTDVLLIVGQVIYYSVKFIQIPNKYQLELNEEYSNIENFSINWLKWFNVSFVSIGLLCVSFYMFNPFHEKNDFFLILFLFSISAFIWVLGIWSFKQKKPEVVLDSIQELSAENSDSLKIKEEELAKSLMAYFEKEKPYLQPDLTLTTVSKVIGTNRTYLSAVINSNFGVNFNVFVNQFRVRYIEDYLKQYPKTTKEELVDIGGFGSISSLKRAMKKVDNN
ncbi:helix-turn-helix domain-containing protein [Aquipluma nitroreducens]|nr:hypothetical protein [Aquipluma nitroreducens]